MAPRPPLPWLRGGAPTGATSVFVWGPDRVAVSRVTLALARSISPDYLWLEIPDAAHPPGPEEAGASGEIPRGQLFFAGSPERLSPHDQMASVALWSVIRSDEPTKAVAPLIDFLRLPDLVQELMGVAWQASKIPVLAVINTDRVAHLYPDDIEQSRSLLQTFEEQGVTLLSGRCGPARSDRLAFRYVFEVRLPSGADWRSATVVCERAPPGSSTPAGEEFSVFPAAG